MYGQEGHWREALLRVPPIAAFILGVAFAQLLAEPTIRKVVRRPTRWVLIAEIAALAVVGGTPGWIPSDVVTGAIAFISAAQMSTFRSLEGIDYSNTLTTANLRAGRNPASRYHAALLAWIVATFAVGAGVCGLCTRLIHHQAAWIAAAVLVVVLIVVIVETRRLEQ